MKNNIKKIILVLLAILFIAELIIYKIKLKEVNKKDEQNIEIDKSSTEYIENHGISVGNIYEYFNGYSGKLTVSEFENIIYEFATEKVMDIYNNTSNLEYEDVLTYYNSNENQNAQIVSEKDYYFIVKDVKAALYDKNSTLLDANIESSTIKKENNKVTGKLILSYINDQKIELNVIMGNDKQVTFESASEISKITDENYLEIDKIVNKFVENIPSLNQSLSLKGENSIREYYDNNSVKLYSMGITSQDDLYQIFQRIEKLKEIKNVKMKNYILDKSTEKTDGHYKSYIIKLEMESEEELELTIYIGDKEVIPNIKLEA